MTSLIIIALTFTPHMDFDVTATYFLAKLEKQFVKLCVSLLTTKPVEQSVVKVGFECVWVSTLLNDLESSLCMPDRLCIKLSQEPRGLEKYSSISEPVGQ